MITPVHDKALIEMFLRRNTPLHLYELGDLDERFWPATTWYGHITNGEIRAMALLCRGLSTPTLLALADAELPELEELCQSLLRTVDHIGLNVKSDNLPASPWHLAPQNSEGLEQL